MLLLLRVADALVCERRLVVGEYVHRLLAREDRSERRLEVCFNVFALVNNGVTEE